MVQAAYDDQATKTGANESELQSFTHKIEELQRELEDCSISPITAAGPTARARKAIAAVKQELAGMDVNIGISRQQLFHLHWKARSQKV
jgi:hypothetical protein